MRYIENICNCVTAAHDDLANIQNNKNTQNPSKLWHNKHIKYIRIIYIAVTIEWNVCAWQTSHPICFDCGLITHLWLHFMRFIYLFFIFKNMFYWFFLLFWLMAFLERLKEHYAEFERTLCTVECECWVWTCLGQIETYWNNKKEIKNSTILKSRRIVQSNKFPTNRKDWYQVRVWD